MQFSEAVLVALAATSAMVVAALQKVLEWLQERRRRATQASAIEHEILVRLREAVGPVADTAGALDDNTAQRLKLLEARLELVEERLPADATLDKLASINDAILATRIEELQRSLERIEGSAMTPGRVTTIVFGVVGALAALVAVVPWILDQLAGT